MTEAETSIIINVNNLGQRIGKHDILKNLSFQVRKGECLGVFGLRGSGKTSLLNILAGIDRFSSGTVEVLGCRLGERDYSYKRSLGLVTQMPSLFHDLTAGENLDYIALLKGCGKAFIKEIIERLELGPYLGQPALQLEVSVYQRLSLACALLNQPEILILDEIIKDIDLDSRKIILNELSRYRQSGGTCVWGFSHPDYYQWLDRLAWLEDGRITMYLPREAYDRWQDMLKSVSELVGEEKL